MEDELHALLGRMIKIEILKDCGLNVFKGLYTSYR